MRLHPLGPLTVVNVAPRIERSAELLRFCRDWLAGVPDSVTAYLGFQNRPDGGDHVFVSAIHVGDPADAGPLLAPLRAFGPPVTDEARVLDYAALYDTNRDAFPDGLHNAWRACFVRDLGDDVIAALADHALRGRGTDLYFVVEHLGGAMARPAPCATAFPHRAARFGIAIATSWRPPAPSARLLGLANDLHAALAPAASGVYVNYLGADATPADAAAAYGENLPRLQRLKRRYDPDNVFRRNINITPADPP
jgi:Berberine and berberine like